MRPYMDMDFLEIETFDHDFYLCFLPVSLRENSIGVEGAKNMAHALHENNSLQDLEWVTSLLSVI